MPTMNEDDVSLMYIKSCVFSIAMLLGFVWLVIVYVLYHGIHHHQSTIGPLGIIFLDSSNCLEHFQILRRKIPLNHLVLRILINYLHSQKLAGGYRIPKMIGFSNVFVLKKYSHVWYLCWISGGCLPGNTLQPPPHFWTV